MKKLLLICSVLLSFYSFSQYPEGINYQAVVRNQAGAIISNSTVGLKLSLRQLAATGTEVYSESFTTVTSNIGLVNVVFGQGSIITGTFQSINWQSGVYFLEIAIDASGGSNYQVLGTQQLMSVPYALFAKKSGDSFSGNYNDLTNQPTIPALVSQLTNDLGFITNPNDADSNPTNEIQNLSLSGSMLTISAGNSIDISSIDTQLSEAQVDAFVSNNGYLLTEVDGSITNELQTLSVSGNNITLSNSGGTVALPAPVLNNTGGRSGNCSGNTGSGTGWVTYNSNTIRITVSTSGCAFTTVPRYFTSIGGLGSHFELVGTSAIYSPSATGFTIYVQKKDGTALSVSDAVSGGWYINWHGIGN